MAKVRSKRGRRAKVETAIAHIKSSFNNTIVSITDEQGNLLASSSAGSAGMKGSRKGTAYAGGIAALEAAKTAMKNNGVIRVNVKITGPGSSKETAVRSLESAGLQILSIQDVTPIPHNGCRSPRPRRV
ncbi:MAG: 30S ribosomal protein S11 [Elusimicrobia bacterium]|nr:30S ribosomal protein S11 [Elusimicrobiota bacterium]